MSAIDNEDLLVTVLAWITQHPENHDQEIWGQYNPERVSAATPCGTAACLAGWTAIFTGRELDFRAGLETSRLVDRDGELEWRSVASYAQQQLGLTIHEAQDLFEAANTRDDLIRLAAEILHISEGELRERIAERGEVHLPREHVEFWQHTARELFHLDG